MAMLARSAAAATPRPIANRNRCRIVSGPVADRVGCGGPGSMQGIAQFFKDGGHLMYVNLAVAVFAAALIAERLYMLGIRYRIDEKRFIGQIEKLVNAGNIEKAVKLCTGEATALLPQVVRSGLMNAR